MTLRDEIIRFGDKLRFVDAGQRRKIVKMLQSFFEDHWEIDGEFAKVKNQLDHFLQITQDGILSYRRDKNKLNENIRRFFIHLNEGHNLNVDLDLLFPQNKFLEKHERIIKLLKYLHEGAKTRGEISEYFGISERVLSNDLNELRNGDYSFLGYNMKINLIRGENTYDSTIHPVFMPLNLSEVYAMTVGLKMTGKGTIFEDVFDYIADSIYAQLSNYGKRCMSQKAEEVGIDFHDNQNKAYRFEDDLLNRQLERGRKGMYAYFLKSGSPCEIEYMTEAGINKITGQIKFVNNHRTHYALDKIQVSCSDDMKIEIDLNNIISIHYRRINNV